MRKSTSPRNDTAYSVLPQPHSMDILRNTKPILVLRSDEIVAKMKKCS